MAWYRTGTANVTSGSAAVLGNATSWNSNGIKPGDVFTVDNVTLYEVQAVGSDTSLTLDRPFAGASTGAGDFAAYAIVQNFSPYPQTVLSTLTALSTQYATLLAGIGTMASQSKTAVQIQGGTIDGTTIGATTPGAGSFTTLSVAKAQNGTTTGLLVSNSNAGTGASAQVGASNGTNGISMVQLGTGTAAAGAIQAGAAYIGASNGLALTANAGPITFGTAGAEWGRFNPGTLQFQVPAGFLSSVNANGALLGMVVTNNSTGASGQAGMQLNNSTGGGLTLSQTSTAFAGAGAIAPAGAYISSATSLGLVAGGAGTIAFGTTSAVWGAFNSAGLFTAYNGIQANASIALENDQAAQTNLTVKNSNSGGAATVLFSTDTADICSFGAFGSTATPGGIIPAGGAFLYAGTVSMTFEVGSLTIGNGAAKWLEIDASGRVGSQTSAGSQAGAPYPWGMNSIDVGAYAAICSFNTNGALYLGNNVYYDGANWKNKNGGTVPSFIYQFGGLNGTALSIDYAAAQASGGTNLSVSAILNIAATTGSVTNVSGSYGAISDESLKQDVTPANDQWADVKAIAAIMKRYRLKADVATDPNAPYLLGVLAQELQKISPGLVDTDPKGLLSVKYSIMTLKAFAALGAAMTRIEALEAKTATVAA
jgi:hypothetical protein